MALVNPAVTTINSTDSVNSSIASAPHTKLQQNDEALDSRLVAVESELAQSVEIDDDLTDLSISTSPEYLAWLSRRGGFLRAGRLEGGDVHLDANGDVVIEPGVWIVNGVPYATSQATTLPSPGGFILHFIRMDVSTGTPTFSLVAHTSGSFPNTAPLAPDDPNLLDVGWWLPQGNQAPVALRGFYDSDWFTINAATTYGSLNHYIGAHPFLDPNWPCMVKLLVKYPSVPGQTRSYSVVRQSVGMPIIDIDDGYQLELEFNNIASLDVRVGGLGVTALAYSPSGALFTNKVDRALPDSMDIRIMIMRLPSPRP